MITTTLEKTTTTSKGVLSQMSTMDHEQVVFCNDEATGLKAIIAIHNTVLGPSLGGTRFWNYDTEEEALHDVLRLSRGMTYKSAISGIHLGGGKAVIIGDPNKLKSEMFWRRYGKFVNSLGGKYITAEDVNTTTSDIEYIALETKYVAGKPILLGGSGDPSSVTAYGVYLGMKACVKERYGNDSLESKKILVQGCGQVGEHLVDLLIKENAIVSISDIKEIKIKNITSKHKVNVIAVNDIYDADMDIYSPCALGATINDDSLNRLQCSIIAGAANNQLEDEIKHGRVCAEKGLLYAPDFLINAGGVINCYLELDGYKRERAIMAANKIYDRTLEIFAKAKKENITTHEAALRIAQERIHDAIKLHSRR